MKRRNKYILFVVLLFFLCSLFANISFSIYKEIQGDTINLNISDSSSSFTITFNSMGGETVPSRTKSLNETVGTLPIPTRTGYIFQGWYTDNTNYTTAITRSTVVTGNATYYAKWLEQDTNFPYVYDMPGECVFSSDGLIDGNGGSCISTLNTTNQAIDYNGIIDRFINTGIGLYNTTNHDLDYEIGFTILNYVAADNTAQATIMNSKNEDTGYPGVVVRKKGNTEFEIASRKNATENANRNFSSSGVNTIRIYRINNTIFYKINNGAITSLNSLSTFNPVFDLNVWFGAGPVDGTATTSQREVVGTLGNMYIRVGDYPSENITITYNANGGTVSPSSVTIMSGGSIGKLPTPKKTGYTFDGWYTDSTFTTQVTSSTPFTQSNEIVAKWLENITITYNANGGTVSPNSVTIGSGRAVGTLPTPEREGYTFDGWYTDSTYTTEVTSSTTFNESTEIVAKWLEIITITYNVNGGTVSPSGITIVSGSTIESLPTPERDGYTFDGWYTDNTYTTEVTSSTTFNESTEIVAKWLENITIIYNADGGTVSPNSVIIASGRAIGTLPTPVKLGYDFVGWYTDNTYTTEVTSSTTFSQSTSIIAKWEESDDITVIFDPDGGTVSPNNKTFAPNTAIGALPVPEKTDYFFAGWYTDNTYTTKVTEDTIFLESTTIVAKWVDETYVACVGNNCYTTLGAAVNAVPDTGVKTTIKILQDITVTATTTIPKTKYVELNIGNNTIKTTSGTYALFTNSGKLDIKDGTLYSSGGYIIHNKDNGILNISGGTLTYDNSGATEYKVIEIAGGQVNITGGDISCNAKAAVINANAGVLNVSGGSIKGSNTFKGQAIYNNGATTTISGTAYLENVSTNNATNGRACVHNNAGIVNILGGTIVSKANSAVKNNGTMTIGNDSNPIDITNPVMQGAIYGLETVSGKPVTIYDGIFKGKGNTPNKAISNESFVTINSSTTIIHTIESIDGDQYDVAYLVNNN